MGSWVQRCSFSVQPIAFLIDYSLQDGRVSECEWLPSMWTIDDIHHCMMQLPWSYGMQNDAAPDSDGRQVLPVPGLQLMSLLVKFDRSGGVV